MRTRSCLILTYVQANRIGEGGSMALARALEHNSSINTLDLGVCDGRKRRGSRGDVRIFVV